MHIEFNENKTLCAQCGGRCCKRMGCEVSTHDVFGDKEPTLERLKAFLAQGGYAVDAWDDDPLKDWDNPNARVETYFVRAAHKGVHKLFDLSWGGECVFLTPTGCSLSWEQRPHGGKALVPDTPHCHSSYGKKDCAIDWYPYQWMFDEIWE